MLDGLGQRYGTPPTYWMERGIVDLMFDAECAVIGSEHEQREVDAAKDKAVKRAQYEDLISQLPPESKWRQKMERQGSAR